MFKYLNDISTLCGFIIIISSCALIFIRPIKICLSYRKEKIENARKQAKLIDGMWDKLDKHIQNDDILKETLQLQNQALLALVRHNITDMYHQCMKNECIQERDQKDLIEQYTIYHSMNGNTYIDEIYPKMMALPISYDK